MADHADTPTGRTVSEAREALGYIPPEDFPEFSDDLARLIAAVRNETIREVREVAKEALGDEMWCDVCNDGRAERLFAALDALQEGQS